ncbi:MAG: acyl-CoA dehydrogenase [Elusimicrobia bacterium CG_4_10_14_3_um_filter_49_12_50_7]|nr:MAG: acyl-CoA dehydrogenase [Elusimicrobia bacterium CG03_land_8_20_14_0_80_50_18]PIX14994.1 MAG: acyl-CoA dehydrogenase [Elusimicrobia bacterium CG_4_8_14_3_um_filter_50_9]PIY17334.1 MAG: acyl-CoA dehydrogenase [Elusimicrobia bacterium CG_4_10_14_3_um_filter_49_12_50_7]
MDYFLTEEQKEMVEIAALIGKEKIVPVMEECDENERFPTEVYAEFAKADLCGVAIPEAYGGLGFGAFEQVLVIEELCRYDAGIGLALAATGLGTLPILLTGSEEQKRKFLPGIASGETITAFGLTESGAGSDAGAMKTTAVKDGDSYILNGSKCFITNGGDAHLYTVIAKTDPSKGSRGASAFIVEKGTAGFSFGKKEKKLGIRSSSTREIIFSDCRIPKENLIAREGMGFIVALKTLDNSRPGVAAQALGIAQGALDDAARYSKERIQFGAPISSIQAVQHLLADMATKTEAARALIYQTAKMIDGGSKNFKKEASMSKLFASDVAMEVTTNAIQVMGGYGYMKDYPTQRRFRDAKITQIYEGTNQIQRNEIANALLKEYC